jgi:hypothetical protein
MSYDAQTSVFMRKTQGLGPGEKVHHLNRGEKILFTSSNARMDNINLAGIWQLTNYTPQGQAQNACLRIANGSVFRAEPLGDDCPDSPSRYTHNVSELFADMWWLHNGTDTASLTQLNTAVKWYSANGETRHTSWEYLPAGNRWDKGRLYRLQQRVTNRHDGSQKAETIRITELKKVGS